LKESLKKIVLSSNISKIPEFILNKEMEHSNKKREKKKHSQKDKESSKSLSLLKKGNSTFSKLFLVSPFPPPPFYHFKNHFPNHLEILDSFGTIP
jgi:hypothetical protein